MNKSESAFPDDPSLNFFETLSPIAAFQNARFPEDFRPLPDSWVVVCTDVEESTQAVNQGRYRGVTMIGAACIIAARNAVPSVSLAYSFGGDGATICVPQHALQPVVNALLGMQLLAKREHQLSLRVGAVPMHEIAKAGKEVRVAKLQSAGRLSQALFSGGGVNYAEAQIKTPDSRYLISRPETGSTGAKSDLTGLECRWEDVRSSGETLSIIVESLEGENAASLFSEIQTEIFKIFSDAVECNPIQPETLKLSHRAAKLVGEIKLKRPELSGFSRIVFARLLVVKNLIGSVLLGVCETFNITFWRDYRRSVVRNTDFLKFADGFKLVLRSTTAQHQLLETYLESLWQTRRAVYGIHVSPGALITCLVVNRTDAHFHFVDGDDGGLTLAAKELKLRKLTWAKEQHIAQVQ